MAATRRSKLPSRVVSRSRLARWAGVLLVGGAAADTVAAEASNATAGAAADLSVTVSAYPDPVPFDRHFEVSVIVAQPSASTAVDTVVNVVMANVSASEFSATSGWSCVATAQGFQCRNPAFSFTESFLRARVSHTRPIGGSIEIRADISSATFDPDPGNNTAGTTLPVSGPYADLYLEFEGGYGQVRPGGELGYDLFVFNSGPSAATAALIEIPLPPATSFVSFERQFGTSPPWTCTTPAVGAGGTVRCQLVQLAHASGAFWRLILRANPGTVGTLINNSATIGSALPDPDLSDNSGSALSLVQSGSESADVSVAITESANPAAPGSTLAQTVTVSNNGPDTGASSGVFLTHFGGEDTTVSTPPGWQCEYLPPPPEPGPYPIMLSCRRPVLPVGASEFRFVSRIAQDATQPVALTANAGSGTFDVNPANNSATSTVGIGTATAVPMLRPTMLAALALLLAAFGARATATRKFG